MTAVLPMFLTLEIPCSKFELPSACARQQLAQRLGITFCEEADQWAMQHVPLYGRGSTFQGQRAQGNASSMGVLERWRTLLDVIVDGSAGGITYRQLFSQDDLLMRCSIRLFGTPPFEKSVPELLNVDGSSANTSTCISQLPSVDNWPCYSHPFGKKPNADVFLNDLN